MSAQIIPLPSDPTGINKPVSHSRKVDRSKPLTLRANFSWTAFGSVFYNFCQYSLFIVIAQITCSPEMAGQYTIGLAVTAPIMIFFGSNLRAVIVSDVRRECQIGGYMMFRVMSLVAAMSVIVTIVLCSDYAWETMLIILVVGVAKSIEGISAILFGYFHQNERMDQIAISRVAKGILSILYFAAGLWITGSILGGVCGLALAWLTTLLFFDIPRAKALATHRVLNRNVPMERLWPVWNTKQLKKLFLLSLPISITVMLICLNTNVPRYFVDFFKGQTVLGIFGPLSYFMVLGNEVVLALGQSATPRMARFYVHGERKEIVQLLLREKAVGVVFGLMGVAVAALVGRWALAVAFGPEYAQYSHVFLLLMITSGITLVFGFSSMFLTAARAFWIQIPVRLCSLTAMTVSCWIFIPMYGIMGAAVAMLISATVHGVLAASAVTILLLRMKDTAEKEATLPHTLAIQNVVAEVAPVTVAEPLSACLPVVSPIVSPLGEVALEMPGGKITA